MRANLWRDWGARATATYSGVDLVPLLEQANRLQLGGGLSVKVNTNVSFYANADYQLAESQLGTRSFRVAVLYFGYTLRDKLRLH